jgi:hypothetical protein
MQTFAKKPLHWAVAAALTGLASAVPMGEALAQDTNVGQALVFPYYTVNNGWVTTIKAINTTDTTLAVKVRFHESKNSRDVLDFSIVLSPYDVWSGWVQEGDDGAPVIYTSDNSCTSPQDISGSAASAYAYTGDNDDTGGQGNGRMREGYVEMLVMGVAPSGWEDEEDDAGKPVYPTAYYAKHVDGVPRDCSKVDASFAPNVPNWVAGQYPPDVVPNGDLTDWCANKVNEENGNANPPFGSGWPYAACDFVAPSDVDVLDTPVYPLKGNLSWLHSETGTGAGTEAIAVGTGVAGPNVPADWSTLNLVTAQWAPWFLEPTFASTGGLWTVYGVQAFEAAIMFAGTLNEWADNPTNGAAVDWVVNFPTKSFHVDWFNEQIQAAVNRYRTVTPPNLAVVSTTGGVVGVTDPAAVDCNLDRKLCQQVPGIAGVGVLGPVGLPNFQYLFGQQGDGDSKVSTTYNLLDSEETMAILKGTGISPAPPGGLALRWETNVLQFATEPVVDSPKAVLLDASAKLDGAPNGWSLVTFDQGALPVVGFAIKERDRGDPATNYGQAMDNGYTLPPPVGAQ